MAPSGRWVGLTVVGFALFLLLVKGQVTAPLTPNGVLVLPLLPSTPKVDGRLDEPIWQKVTPILLLPKPNVRLWAGLDKTAFCFALDGDGVPQDASVVFRFRAGAVYDCVDEFVLLASGQQKLSRYRLTPVPISSEWQAAAFRSKLRWSAEVRIPLATLGLTELQQGDVVPMELVWQSGTPRWQRSLLLYIEHQNVLPIQALSDKQQWSFSNEGTDAALFEFLKEQGEPVIRFRVPARYATMSRTLRLRPNTLYRLEAEVKGTATIYLRARTAKRRGDPTDAYTFWTKPSSDYQRYAVRFPTGETGEAILIIGAVEASGHGEVSLRRLAVVKEAFYESWGPRITVPTNATPVVVEKVLVEDCRALRGFVFAPVDGRLDSPRWDGGVWEYNMPGAGAGVGYAYHNNDGLHITLADAGGVDAVLIRGGARCQLYSNVQRYDDPASGQKVGELPGDAFVQRLLFPTRIRSQQFSFFHVGGGLLADVTFLRIHRNGERIKVLGKPVRWQVVGITEPPKDIAVWLQRRFSEPDRTVLTVAPTGSPHAVSLQPNQTVHFVTVPLSAETAVTAIGIEAIIKTSGTICPMTIVVHDPLNPRAELMRADFVVQGEGVGSIVMDFPDQLVPEGQRWWLSLTALSDASLDKVHVTFFTVPREQAVPQALAYRKLLMKGLFSALSEARPWTGLRRGTNLDEWLRQQGAYEPHLRELFATIEQCRWLSGVEEISGVSVARDSLVRQYDEWVFRYYRPLAPFSPTIDQIHSAPEWAVVLRQAWLQCRKVVQWWLDNRLVPTGEFGGEVGDDTDMYQNYADFPMLEDGEFAQRLKEAARRLMALAEQTTLEQGLNKRTMDPLHAYEEGINHASLLLWWDYGDPVAFERCLVATRSLHALTVVTPKGHRHFKSQRLGAEDLRIDRPTDVDGHAHPLMLHPAFEVAWYSGNPTVLKFLREWADGWLEHMKEGEYATSVEVATEKVIATTDTPIYGGYGSLGSAMAFMFWLTNDLRYLEPFLHVWRQGRDRTSPDRLVPEMFHRGALDHLGQATLRQLAEYRRGVTGWLLTGDKRYLIDALKDDIAELQRFWDMYTTSEPFTDRVFLYAITNAAIAYTGGYATRNKFNHTHAVSWEGFGTEFAALVLKARPNQLKVLVYNFAAKPLIGRMRVWTLQPGRYRVRIGADRNNDDEMDAVAQQQELVLQRAEAIPLRLPPKQVTVVEANQLVPLPPLFPRPDLAVSKQEVQWVGKTLIVPVHNIGSADAPATALVVQDRNGQVVAKASVPNLRAPLDLQPKVHSVRLTLPLTTRPPLQILVDPDNRIVEIYEGNNQATVIAR